MGREENSGPPTSRSYEVCAEMDGGQANQGSGPHTSTFATVFGKLDETQAPARGCEGQGTSGMAAGKKEGKKISCGSSGMAPWAGEARENSLGQSSFRISGSSERDRLRDSFPSALQKIPDDLLGSILEAISRRSSSLEHLLVCKKWAKMGELMQLRVEVKVRAFVSEEELLTSLASFPRLASLRLLHGSIIHLNPTFLQVLTHQCPLLTHLHMDNITGQQRILPSPQESKISRLFVHGRQVPEWVRSIRNLLHLRLKSVQEFPRDFGLGLESLRSLCVKTANVYSFPKSMQRMSALTSLKLTLFAQDHLPSGLDNLPRTITKVQVAGPCIATAEGLYGLTFLRGAKILKLHVGQNLPCLPQDMGRLQSLESFALTLADRNRGAWDSAPAKAVTRIPRSFWLLKSLRKIFFEGLCAEETLAGLGNLTALENLVLHRCHLKQLPSGVSKLNSLKSLLLSDCRLVCDGPDSGVSLGSRRKLVCNNEASWVAALAELSTALNLPLHGSGVRYGQPAHSQSENLHDLGFAPGSTSPNSGAQPPMAMLSC